MLLCIHKLLEVDAFKCWFLKLMWLMLELLLQRRNVHCARCYANYAVKRRKARTIFWCLAKLLLW
ncbi:hypothetical protein HanRHA438_Chr09g0425411 [Helianthus annuus]|nr:hypothetical protein HanIR_Chr09g0445231 [Helianthus annuus]KAJ0890581.1 hypothetical protein HanRHA438_Chr09g0425411 [Helianthus annuus]KAJ0895320.1 hypothetical protein HanPSC8_Chr09g0399201 [Helianthus annuus]